MYDLHHEYATEIDLPHGDALRVKVVVTGFLPGEKPQPRSYAAVEDEIEGEIRDMQGNQRADLEDLLDMDCLLRDAMNDFRRATCVPC